MRTLGAFILAFVVAFAVRSAAWNGLPNGKIGSGMPVAAGTPPNGFATALPAGMPLTVQSGATCVAGGINPAGAAWLEIFPLDGGGVATLPCQCDAGIQMAGIYGTGKTIEFRRTDSAVCSKMAAGGHSNTNIAVGDLVTCPANTPRIEYARNGKLGIRMEGNSANIVTSGEAFSSWPKRRVGAGANPVVTDNTALSPMNTMTADLVQFTACPGSAASALEGP